MSEQNDHDLLIQLHEQVKQVRVDIQKLNDSLISRVERIEAGKLSASDFITFKTEIAKELSDHEARLRVIETWLWRGIGGLAILNIIVALAEGYFLKK